MQLQHHADDLVELFNREFLNDCQTRLVSGGEEPLYQPANKNNQNDCHTIIFTRDYFASGLHEVAHWCIAGETRRQQIDYGYWYAPDGRNSEQQQLFESVEVKPQAIEWIFSTAANSPFRVSADNLSGDASASESFKNNIFQQVMTYCQNGLPPRAARFARQLANFYRGDDSHINKVALNQKNYSASAL